MSRGGKGGGRSDSAAPSSPDDLSAPAASDASPLPEPPAPGSPPAAPSGAAAVAATPGSSAPAVPAPRLELPAFGLADEILAALQAASGAQVELPPGGFAVPGGPRGATEAAPREPAAGSTDAGARHRVYSFADALARRTAEAERAPQEQPESWVIFELAGERFGLPVTAVQEILRVGAITRVPHTPAPVRGITNLRGRVLAVVDLRVRLGMSSAELAARNRILVVDSRQRTLGLLVDAALQVVKLLPSTLEPAPDDVLSTRSDYLLGVYHLDDQLIIALDLDRVLLVHPEDDQTQAAGEPGDLPALGAAFEAEP